MLHLANKIEFIILTVKRRTATMISVAILMMTVLTVKMKVAMPTVKLIEKILTAMVLRLLVVTLLMILI